MKARFSEVETSQVGFTEFTMVLNAVMQSEIAKHTS